VKIEKGGLKGSSNSKGKKPRGTLENQVWVKVLAPVQKRWVNRLKVKPRKLP